MQGKCFQSNFQISTNNYIQYRAPVYLSVERKKGARERERERERKRGGTEIERLREIEGEREVERVGR